VNLFYLGDKYGRNSNRYFSFARYLRPLNYDFGIDSFERNVWLDHVESDVGKSVNSSDICDIQLLVSKNERKE
jgi:hypothetical protein